VTVFDLTASVTGMIIFIYMITGLAKDDNNSKYVFVIFVLRLLLNTIIGLIATICLSIMCCNCAQAKLCIENKCYDKRWRIFKVYTVSRMVEMSIIPPLDITTIFLADSKIENLNWAVWLFLSL
jgi:hypothetical protein